MAYVMGNRSLNAAGKVPLTWLTVGIQSTSFMVWYKKRIHVVKYLDVREMDKPKR